MHALLRPRDPPVRRQPWCLGSRLGVHGSSRCCFACFFARRTCVILAYCEEMLSLPPPGRARPARRPGRGASSERRRWAPRASPPHTARGRGVLASGPGRTDPDALTQGDSGLSRLRWVRSAPGACEAGKLGGRPSGSPHQRRALNWHCCSPTPQGGGGELGLPRAKLRG